MELACEYSHFVLENSEIVRCFSTLMMIPKTGQTVHDDRMVEDWC